jgi:hypothetical protein
MMISNELSSFKLWVTSMESTAKTNDIDSKRETTSSDVGHGMMRFRRPALVMHA